jgi:hypothetical protein
LQLWNPPGHGGFSGTIAGRGTIIWSLQKHRRKPPHATHPVHVAW